MGLNNQELIEEFFENNKYKYPNMTIEQMKEICFMPWSYTKKNMESGELSTVRLKYFGTFQVYEGRARHMIHSLKQRFKFHKIDSKQYFKLKEMIEKYLKQYDKD